MRLLLAVNKADLLPAQATPLRLEARAQPFLIFKHRQHSDNIPACGQGNLAQLSFLLSTCISCLPSGGACGRGTLIIFIIIIVIFAGLRHAGAQE